MDNQSSLGDQFLKKIHQNIEDNLGDENFSVKNLAENVGLSRSMLHRKLIKLTGKSASDFIKEIRLKSAHTLLKNDVATASEIAYQVGFRSPSYFNKVFKKRYGVSPGDVRKGAIVSSAQPSIYQKVREGASLFVGASSILKLSVLMAFIIVVAGSGIFYYRKNKVPTEKSIAVLPFTNRSTEKENQYFADGIVDGLVNRLSIIDGLKVISRTSSEMFREKGDRTAPEIAKLLGVKYLLEGAVQRDAKNIRLNVKLIDAEKDNHVWANLYDRELEEIFEIQTDLSEQITRELAIVLSIDGKKKLQRNQTKNLKALEYKHMGRYHLNTRTQDGLRTSVNYFKLAIKEDPDYGLAYAELADSYFIMAYHGFMDRRIGMDSARYLALKALEIDENLAEAHSILAYVLWDFDWKKEAGEIEFLKGIEINPNHAPSYQYYSEFLSTYGEPKKAREYINKAIILNPYSFVLRIVSSRYYLRDGDYKNALQENKFAQELCKNHLWTMRSAYIINVIKGDELAALDSFKKYGEITGNWTAEEADSAFLVDKTDGLLQFGVKFEKSKIEKAKFYALLGEVDLAVDLLDSLLQAGSFHPYYTTSIIFEKLRFHPRYIAILDSIGI